MDWSVLIFIGLLLGCVFLPYMAEKREKFVYLALLAVLLSFFAGFRGVSVGLDTQGYANMFQLIADGRQDEAYGLETQFKVVCMVLSKVYNNSSLLFILCAILTNFLVILRIWDFRGNASLVMMVVVYYVSFYFQTMNIMRQMCACALLFYGTRFIPKRKYIISLLFVALALIFHQSAIIGIAFLLLEIFQWRYLNAYQKKIYVSLVVILAISAAILYKSIEKYFHYFAEASPNIGLMLFVKLTLFLLAIIEMRVSKVCCSAEDNEKIYRTRCVLIYYFIGICLTAVGYIYPYMDRVGLPFYIFETICWGMIVKNSPRKYIWLSTFLFLLLYNFVYTIVNDGQGILPYMFIWQAA